jgi:tartrate dehydratase beta subunit/fumarate hydratase class I family protein
MSDPSCRAFRELLGVYVVGAIEPAERAAVDAHLSGCYECREELANLAVLPALLHRVPAEEVERMVAAGPETAGQDEPSHELLDSLLAKVGAKRRSRRVRALFTTAAAIIIAAGGAAAITQAVSPSSAPATSLEVAALHEHGVDVTVHYGRGGWDSTTMWVRAAGIPQGTQCQMWVVTTSGRRIWAGGWLLGPGGSKLWYPVRADIPESSLKGFVLAAGSKVLSIPA